MTDLPAAWWTHGDPDPQVCGACADDAIDDPEGMTPPHDPEPAGEDEDGPYCYCGHHIEREREEA